MPKNNFISEKLKNRHFIWIAAVIILISIGVIKSLKPKTEGTAIDDHTIFEVKEGPLQISVIESGTIEASNLLIIRSKVRGRISILTLVEEGTQVKKGDLLMELDASDWEDKKINQQIQVRNAEASSIISRETLAVVENQARSDIDKAELSYEFARQDLRKYMEGDYPNKLKEAESRITLAKEEISRTRDKLLWSKKLYKEKYISKTELQADELAEKKKILDLELAQNELNLLKNFTHKRELAQLETDVKQAKMALDRTIRKAKADIVQAKANLKAKEAESERQKTKLKKILKQIKNAKIYAPADGLVIYATSAKRGHKGRPVEPLQAGQLVREYQDLIYLPKGTAALAVIMVHEFNLDKIRKGQPVIITVDAIPGLTIKGRVARIASLPNPQRAFLNPDLKVYNAEIYLSGFHKSLRTGMNCKAEIIIAQYKKTTYLPVQAVLHIGDKTAVYVVKNKTLELRNVVIGLDNNRMVRIVGGLKPGELVSLTPPLQATAIKPSANIIDLNKVPGLKELKGNETFSSDESSTNRQTNLSIEQEKKKKKKKKKKKF